jgi:hypothetical protein
MKLRYVLPVLLALSAAPAAAGEPRAVLRGPQTATVDQEFWLKLAGTVSEGQIDLELAGGPSPVEPVFLFSKDGVPVYAVTSAPHPGSYVFALVAHGTDAAGKPKRSYAFWTVVVVAAPGPAPGPAPSPSPAPSPAPAPAPSPSPKPSPAPEPPPAPAPPDGVKGKLWSVLILPDTPDLAQSAARTDPALRAAMAARDVTFRSYLASESEVNSPLWAAALAKAGGAPAVIWMTAEGRFLRATKAPDAPAVLAALKQIRGEP